MTAEAIKNQQNSAAVGGTGNYPDKIRSLPLYDGNFDAHKLKADGCEVLFACYPAGTRVPPHSHDTENHGVITRGKLTMKINGKTSTYETGDWYHVPVGVMHEASVDEDTDTIEMWFAV